MNEQHPNPRTPINHLSRLERLKIHRIPPLFHTRRDASLRVASAHLENNWSAFFCNCNAIAATVLPDDGSDDGLKSHAVSTDREDLTESTIFMLCLMLRATDVHVQLS